MKTTLRLFAFAALAAAALAVPARAQSDEKIIFDVNATVRISGRTLAPGKYKIGTSAATGVFTIEDITKGIGSKQFLISSGVTVRLRGSADRPQIVVERAADGAFAITEVYFPLAERTYTFTAEQANKALTASAQAKKEDLVHAGR